ncbi:MAG: anti-sigma factor antagonist [Solirubrobacteraceae bacterium]
MTSVSTESFDVSALTDVPYSCAVHRRGKTSEIVLEGELDLAAKPVLEEAVVQALEPGPVETVIVDLTRVTFADSTTMTWLVQADTRTKAAGGRLVAVAGPGPVREVLQMTGIDERVTLVADGRMR